MQIEVSLPGYEFLRVQLNAQGELQSYQLEVSVETLNLFHQLLAQFGPHLESWQLAPEFAPRSFDDSIEGRLLRRSHLLLGELIQKAKGGWQHPYQGEMVCNCRQVRSEHIDHSIVAGVKDWQGVAQWTGASTVCTSCRFKVEEVLKSRAELLPESSSSVISAKGS